MNEVELLNVSKAYGSEPVIENVSLEVHAHELVVFLGPSGCGKSTLLRLIAGLEIPDRGLIHIAGRRVDLLPPAERRVAMVFQQYALYPHMSVWENMAFGLRNFGIPAEEVSRRVGTAAAMLELEQLLDRKPAQLSGGQQQRVALGRALVKDPRVLLLDEPLSNLDAALRARMRLQLVQLHRRLGAAMVFVTHDQMDAMTLASRVVVMNHRRIEQIGSPMEIYSRPATTFVAGFIGTPPMNLLPVRLSHSDGANAGITLANGLRIGAHIDIGDGAGDESCMFGIRAENIQVCEPGAGHVVGAVQFVERLGNRALIHASLDTADPIIIEAAAAARCLPGEAIGLRFDLHHAYLFRAGRICDATLGVQ